MTLKNISHVLTHDITNGSIRAMLYGLGLTESKFNNYFVGVGSMKFDINPCNKHLNKLQNSVLKNLNNNNLNGFGFNTIGVSDGITNGNSGMHYSLPSRELITDSIETMIKAHHYDGFILIPGCDKNLPASMMAMGRINRPSILLYGGTMLPGNYNNKDVDIIDAFTSYGNFVNGEISMLDRENLLKNCCDSYGGSCSGMYTCNTMAIISEVMGLSPLFSSTNPASSQDKRVECETIVKTIKNMLDNNICPRDIISRESFINAIKITTIMGGSTNAVLHLIAIAYEFDIKLNLEDFAEINKNTPVLANLKPHGKYSVNDIYKMGGMPIILNYLIDAGLINGDTYTITGKTLKEDIKLLNLPKLIFNQDIFFEKTNYVKKDGHIKILYGNLCSGGSIAKISGKEGTYFKGPAIVFESEKSMLDSLYNNNNIKEGMVIIIRNQGPKGGIGMPELLKPSSELISFNLSSKTALLTDGRWSGGSSGFLIGHITPESYENNSILSIVNNDDIIEIDINNNSIDLLVSEEIINQRFKNKKNRQLVKKSTSYLSKYQKLVSDASNGCIVSS